LRKRQSCRSERRSPDAEPADRGRIGDHGWRHFTASTGMIGRVPARRSPEFILLAVSSGGGHWEELMLLRPALDRFDPVFAATDAELSRRDDVPRFHVLPDANRDGAWRAFLCLLASIRLVRAIRPSVLVTTGALPGLFCLVAARLSGAHTIWIDSIANSDQPSLSGRWARPFAHQWFTQWAHLAGADRRYEGALL
jgi:UDP-N-acetylglucosamine:LPS N-acetylglucosamine transferase